MQQQGRTLHCFGHRMCRQGGTGYDVDVVSGSKAARSFLSNELLAETLGANAFAVRLAVRDHLNPGDSALTVEERRKVDVFVLTDLTIEEGVPVDTPARVRDVEDVLPSFELLAQALLEPRAVGLRKLDTLEVDELRLAELLGE